LGDLWIVPCVAIAVALLVLRAWYLLQPSTRFSDADVYLTLGRGILNGFRPYVDLFEIKPPGMFLLSAASLASFGGGALGNLLTAGSMFLLPALVAMSRFDRRFTKNRLSIASLGFIGTALLVLYLSIQGLPWQSELFGALAGMMYVLSIERTPSTWLQTGFSAFALLAAVGIKEPFLLSLLASALLLSTSPRDFARKFIVPALAATLLGFVGLFAWGIVDPYLTVYLPTLLQYSASSDTPVALRGLRFDLVWAQFRMHSPLLPLNLTIWATIIILLGRSSALLRRWSMRRVALGAGALWLAALSAGLPGTYYTQHFAFPIPAYFALFVLLLKRLSEAPSRPSTGRAVVILIPLAVSALLTTSVYTDALTNHTGSLTGLQQSIAFAENRDQKLRAVAQQVDNALDECGIDRYFLIRTGPEYISAYTHHSPANFYVFAPFPYEFLSNPTFEPRMLERLRTAEVIVAGTGSIVLPASPLGDALRQMLTDSFTSHPRSCVESPITGPYRLYFRQASDSDRQFPVPVVQRTLTVLSPRFQRLTAIPDHEFQELQFATARFFDLPIQPQSIHFAVVPTHEAIVYVYNAASMKFESRFPLTASGVVVNRIESSSKGFVPPLDRALMR